MKKLYRKGTVHPSPPIISDHLAFLPATILTLTAALSPEDREVLAYLISFSASNSPGGTTASSRRAAAAVAPKGGAKGGSCSGSSSASGDHPPQFNCDCFRCYTSYWVRWGSSPNRELIHEIIDAFEDELLLSRTKGAAKTTKRERRKQRNGGGNIGNGVNTGSGELKRSELSSGKDEPAGESESVQGHEGGGGGEGDEEEVLSSEKGSVRRFVSFIGERIWGVLG
ncbi:hypothetical protein L484_013616 [Morus notabilis]|uniref:Uncharacterized protein n=1 Tax=Morus notabilis TaxID=981085 RepID=W9QUM1_9ROSA|nr:uncharacterized protein LOC21396786 [Morus notabilis]EXB41542.1 hypothetical protein L484_013616 [Morus notabilis]